MRRLLMSAVLGSLLVAGCDRGSHPGNIDKPAPQFVMGDGIRTVDLSKLRGRVVVLNLWATWCAPCIEELPSLLALQRQMPELAIVAVSMDQDPDVYKRFLVDHHVDLLTVRDEDQKVNALYGTVQIPETYIIDKQGVLRRKFIGAQVWTSSEITSYLSKM
ncbi:TlpA family protein disulfide reductase [Tunturibacter empetritectus]|uniref:Thiol-disulfide isomerase/thioredoxin n=1 Tax=Tunturiibacter empetritectus TaxID=3069691 RepID=A0A7W8MRG6_9BACT|nr:TlpA disulfide reductase family protein [Edaphobacter lichenicola]MBB5316229.1 thiol-disulfide isomerase/thioredoxin [Edaphobacter lichenicola]